MLLLLIAILVLVTGIVMIIFSSKSEALEFAGSLLLVVGILSTVVLSCMYGFGLTDEEVFASKYDDALYLSKTMDTYGYEIKSVKDMEYYYDKIEEIRSLNEDIQKARTHLNSKWIGKMYRKEIAEKEYIPYPKISVESNFNGK